MFGKVLGALVGLAVGLMLQSTTMAIFFGCIGLVLGHLLLDGHDEGSAEKPAPVDEAVERSPQPPSPAAALAELLCPLFVEVARSDGPVTQAEVRVIREYFEQHRGFDPAALEPVRQALKAALAGPPVELEAQTKKARAKLAPAERLPLVSSLYELALVDGDLSRAESEAIREIVASLNLSDEQAQQIASTHLGSGAEAYQVLGVTPRASDDELRRAYRKLASDLHPDRFAGKDKASVEAAAERFRRVTEAWAQLRKLRGL